MVPALGAVGMANTLNVKVALDSLQGYPDGLLVVTVITIMFPISFLPGVYVNENGDSDTVAGLTEPSPFSVILTCVALPPKTLPLIVTGVVPHVLPVLLLRVTTGSLTHSGVCPNPLIGVNKKREIRIKDPVNLSSLIEPILL